MFGDELHQVLRIRVASAEFPALTDVVDADDQRPGVSIALLFECQPEGPGGRSFSTIRYRHVLHRFRVEGLVAIRVLTLSVPEEKADMGGR